MVWFRNAVIYEFGESVSFNKETLNDALNTCLFQPCGQTTVSTFGWTAPFYDANSENASLFIEMEGHFLLRVKKESKILPSNVIKSVLQDKIEERENTLSRKLSKTEKVAIKEATIIELLPRAFSRYSHYSVWIDTVNRRIVVDVSSFKLAEEILSLLRKSMGSLPVLPFTSQTPMEKVMTQWLTDRASLSGFSLGDEVELIDHLDEGSQIKFKKCDIESDEVLMHIKTGRELSKVMLINEGHHQFILNRDVTLKRIKFENELLESNSDFLPEEKQQQLESNFLIMVNSLANGINKLQKMIK